MDLEVHEHSSENAHWLVVGALEAVVVHDAQQELRVALAREPAPAPSRSVRCPHTKNC